MTTSPDRPADQAAGSDVVLHTVENGIATLTLNRPDRLNAWTPEMEVRYFDLLERSAADPAVRVIVVTGAGKGFCAGADMAALRDTDPEANARRRAVRSMTFPLTIPKPIIGAINGACAGLGLAQALMCDLRFAAAGAKFTTAFSKLGLVAEHGTSWHLPMLVGIPNALDLLYSSRVVLAEEAQQLGLVNRVVPPDDLMDEVRSYARHLVDNISPAAMADIKDQVYRHVQMDRDEALEESNRLVAESLTRDDFAEGVTSFQERRQPRFRPLPRS